MLVGREFTPFLLKNINRVKVAPISLGLKEKPNAIRNQKSGH